MFISSKAMTKERLRPVGLSALKHIRWTSVHDLSLNSSPAPQELITTEWFMLALPLTKWTDWSWVDFLWNPSRQIVSRFFKADFLGLYHHNLVKELPKIDKTLGIWNISQHRNEQDNMRESSTLETFHKGHVFCFERQMNQWFLFSKNGRFFKRLFFCAFNAISMHRRSTCMEGDYRWRSAASKDFQNGHLWMIRWQAR